MKFSKVKILKENNNNNTPQMGVGRIMYKMCLYFFSIKYLFIY